MQGGADNTGLNVRQRLLSRAVFFKQRWRSTPECYVTCPGNPDGMGAQLHARLSTMLYARTLGLQYAHTPFRTLQHAPPGEARWSEKWEDFIGLGLAETPAAAIEARLGPPRRVESPTQIRVGPATFWAVPHCHTYANLHPHRYPALSRIAAKRYRQAPKGACVPHYTPGALNVAVHIRRGDVTAASAVRYTPNAYYVAVLGALRAAAGELSRPLALRVFSEGQPGDFPELRAADVRFHLNEDLFVTFHSIVSADVIVLAKSCLSYAAGLLSAGLKIYQPTGHQPLPDWIVADAAGNLNRGALRRALAEMRNPGPEVSHDLA